MDKNTNIEKCIKLNTIQKKSLESLGINTIIDFLYHFPGRFENNEVANTDDYKKGDFLSFQGVINSSRMKRTMGKKRIMITEATIKSGKNFIKSIWFNQPYITKMFPKGSVVVVKGKIAGDKTLYLNSPEIKNINLMTPTPIKDVGLENLTPIYKTFGNITSNWIKIKMDKILSDKNIMDNLEDPIPENILNKLNLPVLSKSLIWIHQPKNEKQHIAAKKRFIFQEMFIFQIANLIRTQELSKSKTYPIIFNGEIAKKFLQEKFEFKPTKSQEKVVDEIVKDINSKKVMNRILEGDVGFGKTAIAASIMYSIVKSTPEEKTSGKPQVAYMAPTEILAFQQFNNLIKFFEGSFLKIALLTSKNCMKFPSKVNPTEATKISKNQLKKWIENGEIPVIVGTHSLIQKELNFKRLSLVLIDEQHRFGVLQRQKLLNSYKYTPHLLSMTATPIPRSLMLTFYGALSLSVLDEAPAGRKKVETKFISSKNISKVHEHIEKEVNNGKQIFVVCPRVEKDDKDNLRSVDEEYKDLSVRFEKNNVAIMHGKLKTKEKEKIMGLFRDKKIDILVCTTVVEVGIDVPNASTMVILHSERFGLAQLHQLRGRVSRGKDQSYCFIVSDTNTDSTLERLKFFEKNNDGFKLAEKDLDARGSGDLIGIRQSGVPDMLMEAIKNRKLVEIAESEAREIMKKDKNLNKNKLIKELVEKINFHNE